MSTLTAVLVLVGMVATTAAAQNVTTGSLSGVVRDAQGGVLPGATVVAVHTPTGTTYEGVTQGDGRFSILNVRVGGPYELTVTMPGFRTQTLAGVNVALGQSSDIPVTLQLETITETVQVTAEASSVFTSTNTGTTANIDTEAIESLPTIQRSLQDFARVNPYFNQTASNSDPSALSVAGRNTRYNNIQIDGAVNNDLFGLAASGTPGGQADTEPISIDAIQELQLVVSPYDVRQGGFSGGGVNAITKSGSNDFHGTAFFFTRDQDLVGNGINDVPIATFTDKQGGASLGGPIVENKAFFFGNFDLRRRNTPSGYSIGGTGTNFGHAAEAQRFVDILKSKYGYDPGGLDEYIRGSNNDKIFVRADLNVARNHQLTVRHNYVDGFSDVGTQSNSTYKLPDNFYRFNTTTNSTVVQLNSTFGAMVNEARVTYQTIRENRDGNTPFPQVQVDLDGGDQLRAGREQFSAANSLDQDVLELTNDLTMVKGAHTITVGTHNEFFKFSNLFIRDNFGTYRFSSLDNFAAGIAQSFDYSFSLTGNPKQPAEFGVNQIGLYAGDQWRLAPNFTLTYGVRWDKPFFPDTPTANPAAAAVYGFGTDVVPSTQTISPRAGFNWDLSNGSDSRQQLRGGLGLFGGRTPYVWLSNQYGNTGIEFRRLSVRFGANNQIPFVADPNGQPTTLGSASTNEIDVVDPDYSFPQLIRGNLGYDRSLPFGIVGTVEFLFSKVVKDINYQNLNLQAASTLEDGRTVYGRVDPSYSDVILLTNTDQGSSWSIATQLEKPFSNGFLMSGSYLYGRAKSINDGTSSQARSNWINVYTAGNLNDVPLATSNFDVRHRITLSTSYIFDLKAAHVTTSVYYNGQSGRPYSYLFGSDVSSDGSTTNDLLYFPNPGDVTITGGTYEQLAAFINDGNCTDIAAGSILARNICRSPWTNTLDFHLGVDVPIGRFRPEFTFDIQNLLNLFDSSAGQVEYATFNDLLVTRATTSNGQYTYQLNDAVTGKADRWSRDDLRSRWQGQIGVRIRF
ncbi:MAG: carboxypeptidase regulatory-like domain-containing protein [Vicinamibacterales bacterium]